MIIGTVMLKSWRKPRMLQFLNASVAPERSFIADRRTP
jgi:hypothetical protein